MLSIKFSSWLQNLHVSTAKENFIFRWSLKDIIQDVLGADQKLLMFRDPSNSYMQHRENKIMTLTDFYWIKFLWKVKLGLPKNTKAWEQCYPILFFLNDIMKKQLMKWHLSNTPVLSKGEWKLIHPLEIALALSVNKKREVLVYCMLYVIR